MTSLEPSHASARDQKLVQNSLDGRVHLSRSPHPYHRRSISVAGQDGFPDGRQRENTNVAQRLSSSGSSDSGTEADDERGSLLRGLPAPPFRVHKGLRGSTPFFQSPAISPLPTPPLNESETRRNFLVQGKPREARLIEYSDERRRAREKYVRRKRSEIVRRFTETSLLLGTSILVCNAGSTARDLAFHYEELTGFALAIISLYSAYPFRLSLHLVRRGTALQQALRSGFHVPSRFDPGALLYPVLLPCLLAISLLPHNPAFFLPNLVLGLSSIPPNLIPLFSTSPCWSQVQWAISLAPLAASKTYRSQSYMPRFGMYVNSHAENLTLLCPLQKTLIPALEYLTTTSLDPSELQLLATGLIDLLVFSTTPQMQILKSLLWIGGVALFVSCSRILSWEVALARIPGWKFARRKNSPINFFPKLDYDICQILVRPRMPKRNKDSSSDEGPGPTRVAAARKPKPDLKIDLTGTNGLTTQLEPVSAVEAHPNGTVEPAGGDSLVRRRNIFPEHTTEIPKTAQVQRTRSKRSTSPPSSSFLSLSPAQATVRKWLYAGCAYLATATIILIPIRKYVSVYALSSHEPFGWALGYLLGNIPEFRFLVVSNNLEKWIALPSRLSDCEISIHESWLEQLRQTTIGPATSRLFISAYCSVVLLLGITVVFRLTTLVEVDTRRKVFHGIMVAMLLPTIFVDPCFIALALALILAIFLLLDLFRASQLPPISKPLTYFLAPYVDGRDHRGPVIVSHIFLLIGCATPLWLSLAATERAGVDPWVGWDVEARDVSMISGVVCVGMGDAAASLIGRRYGKTKWYWGGGKSLEGSLAFAVAVTIGLMASYTWLRLGGWVPLADSAFFLTLGKCALAGIGASLMESTLTAANDNVVVPLGLWLLVRGLEI